VDFSEPKLQLLSSAAQDLIQRMLNKDPTKRLSFQECLSHCLFTEKNRDTHTIFNFTRHLEPKVIKENFRESQNLTNKIKESFEDAHSFIIGRANIIKGKTETVQELGVAEQLKNYQQMEKK